MLVNLRLMAFDYSSFGNRRKYPRFTLISVAEVANQDLKKGRPVFIEGSLQLDTWEDKQTGQK